MSKAETDLPKPFGDYVPIKRLGQGSYANVYLVKDSASNELALKWLRDDAERTGPMRFQNEAWALNQFDHPGLPRLVDSGEQDGRPWLAMTLARGTSLRKLMASLQNVEGSLVGHLRAIEIAIAVLDALNYMHGLGIFHRDVKDDNIITNDSVSQVALVDLGFCRGTNQPADVSSFLQVGAPRYSPPSKLRNPSQVHATHDVFAVGVVLYYVMTGEYPWSVKRNEDRGALEEQMCNHDPRPIHEINSLVPHSVWHLVDTLINRDDDRRPTAAEALDAARTLRDNLAEARVGTINSRQPLLFPRVIRDPLHGDIRMTDFEWRLIDTPEMQRLRRVRQLGFTNFVFPGAEHSRLMHSLGCVFVVDKVLRSVADVCGYTVSDEERLAARTYALIHDVTHVAFGHTVEDELGFFTSHDRNNGRISRLLLSDDSSVGALLRSTEYGRAVLAHFDPESTVVQHTYIRELLEGPNGADVLDYIDRDSLFCGLDHRVDSAVYRRFRIHPDRSNRQQRHVVARVFGGTGIRLDAEFALESILLERFALFMKVYTHPVKAAAGAMLGKALAEAMYGGRGKAEIDERGYELLGDSSVIELLKASRKAVCSDLARRIERRELFKPVFRANAIPGADADVAQYEARRSALRELGLFAPNTRLEFEAELAKKAGLKANEVAVYCPPKAPGFQKVQQYVERAPGEAKVVDHVHKPYMRILQRHLQLWSIYVFCPPEVDHAAKTRLAEAAENMLGLSNVIESHRRQNMLF